MICRRAAERSSCCTVNGTIHFPSQKSANGAVHFPSQKSAGKTKVYSLNPSELCSEKESFALR